MRKIKIAQIGTGHDHAGSVLAKILDHPEIFEFVGYYVDEGGEENYKKYYGEEYKRSLDEIFNYPGLDAVAIETEDKYLTKYAIMAAERGIHIHMDKPGGISDADFEYLIKTAKKNNVIFHTGYMYRYNPSIIKLKEDIKNGKLGEVYSVEAHMGCEHPPKKRQWLADYPGGMLYYLGCHLIDLILSIMGTPEEIVPLSASIGADGVTAEDFGMAAFKYKNGTSFARVSGLELGGFVRRQLVVCGTKGTVTLEPLEWYTDEVNPGSELYTGIREIYEEDTKKTGWVTKGKQTKSEPYDRYFDMLASFAAMVRGEKENPISYEYELLLHKVLLNACGVKTEYKNEIIL